MSKVTSIFVVLATVVLFGSCDFATFEQISLDSNISEYNDILKDDFLSIQFSIEPESQSVENLLTLRKYGNAIEAEFTWQGRTVLIRPYLGWEKGGKYTCSMSGPLLMQDNRLYTVEFSRCFFYLDPLNNFKVDSYLPSFDALIGESDSFSIVFSKPVEVASFVKNFKLYPECEKKIIFSADNATVTIVPTNGWPINTIYQWSLESLLAEDGFALNANYSSRFRTSDILDYPRVLRVIETSLSSSGCIYGTDPIDNMIIDRNLIAIVFSKDIDFTSVAAALSFVPSIKGYCAEDPDNADRIIYIPQEAYKIETRYQLKIASTASDSLGLAMSAPFAYFFTSANKWLEISDITLDSTADISGNIGTDIIADHTILASLPGDDKEVVLEIGFSSSIEESEKSSVIKNIQVSAFFPSSADIPYLSRVTWNPGNTLVTMTWKNFSVTTLGIGNIYRIRIAGGQSGMNNGRGEFMKEDACVYFKAL